ncbi:antA/AntB antirepressor family protein [Paenibacillus sp. GYB004]|uniref:antA/AntB antirepressor family protein n=1 Tax=Paenibacillus sp. GYB004 TaxID=2994393 RepID=UPI002F96A802
MIENKQLVSNDLLPVYRITDTGEQVVDARELHGFLNVSSKFADWIKNRIEKFGFVEGEDFSAVSKILENGGRSLEYVLKLDMAKELAMVENNELGRKARRYFIEVEKRLRQPARVPLADEHDQITRLLQMLRMSEREKLFSPETDQALRVQIAELVLREPGRLSNAQKTEKSVLMIDTDYTGRWYSTKEIAVIAGVTVHLIAKLASEHNLRTDEYSRERPNSVRRSTGLIQIQYNETGKNRLVQLAKERINAGYVPNIKQKWRRTRRTRRPLKTE